MAHFRIFTIAYCLYFTGVILLPSLSDMPLPDRALTAFAFSSTMATATQIFLDAIGERNSPPTPQKTANNGAKPVISNSPR